MRTNRALSSQIHWQLCSNLEVWSIRAKLFPKSFHKSHTKRKHMDKAHFSSVAGKWISQLVLIFEFPLVIWGSLSDWNMNAKTLQTLTLTPVKMLSEGSYCKNPKCANSSPVSQKFVFQWFPPAEKHLLQPPLRIFSWNELSSHTIKHTWNILNKLGEGS